MFLGVGIFVRVGRWCLVSVLGEWCWCQVSFVGVDVCVGRRRWYRGVVVLVMSTEVFVLVLGVGVGVSVGSVLGSGVDVGLDRGVGYQICSSFQVLNFHLHSQLMKILPPSMLVFAQTPWGYKKPSPYS